MALSVTEGLLTGLERGVSGGEGDETTRLRFWLWAIEGVCLGGADGCMLYLLGGGRGISSFRRSSSDGTAGPLVSCAFSLPLTAVFDEGKAFVTLFFLPGV